jgi:Flp pilus assembly protein TadD
MLRFTLALASLAALGACATAGGHKVDAASPAGQAAIDQAARQAITHEDMLTQMTFWAGEFENHPEDVEAARSFAESLRKGARFDRAIEVSMQALQRHQSDTPLLMTLGKSLIAAGRPQEALRPLAMVAAAEPQNWQARSALGAALDQVGRFGEARQAYHEALAISPNQTAVLTNMGVSYLLAGAPADAEPFLRQAADQPSAPAEARQNLAVALALQGRFDEAAQLERVDLPPDMAAENLAYLRSLVSDPRRWGDLRAPTTLR